MMGLGGAIFNLLSQAVGKPPQQGDSAQPDENTRSRIVKSGAGLAIACVVIAVFVLAATFLKSVLFGLIFAYFLLPMEKAFERLILKISPKTDFERLALKASILTFSTLVLGVMLSCAIAFTIALPTISATGDRVRDWIASNERIAEIESQVRNELGIVNSKTPDETKKRGKLDAIATWATGRLEAFLDGKESKQSLTTLAIDGGQDIVQIMAVIATFAATFLLDILLTFFFLFYFLQKMACFESLSGVGNGRLSTGAWLVKGIFETDWMPHTGEEAKAEASSVIDRICLMLRAWVRGYLSIIILESILYISSFMLFKVPYAPVLGFVAGCTILVPFLGPVASGILTLCVCLGAGSAGLFTIIGVLATYIIIHGVVEQLILYPRLVGESIGLTSLETIIVVLLGGFFAGVAGMIFAVPAAAVLRYLIPTLYHYWVPVKPARQD